MSRPLFDPVFKALLTALMCIVITIAVTAIWAGGWSNLDFSSLTVLQMVRSDAGGVVLLTTYNPLAIALPAVMMVTGVASLSFNLVSSEVGHLSSPKTLATASRELTAELSKVLASIRAHLGSSAGYAQSLAGAQSRLEALDASNQVRVIVSLLLAENERMRRETSSLNGELENSAARIENLNRRLFLAEQEGLKDPLTSVGNRRCFDETLRSEIEKARASLTPLSLVMCDVDNFKLVNDTFGHAVGDEVLKAVARVLGENLRQGDSLARFGGEEFGIILPQTALSSATGFAERIRRRCEAQDLKVRATGKKLGKITVSFGVAELRDREGPEDLVARSDANLYEAKRGGRNRVAAETGRAR